MVHLLNIMLQLTENKDIIECFQLRPMKYSTKLQTMTKLVVVTDNYHIFKKICISITWANN